MKDKKAKVLLSDGRFHYCCNLKDLSPAGFTACDLPLYYDEKVVAEVSLILGSNLTLKMRLMVDSARAISENEKKDIIFRIIDPPLLWRTYIEDV